MRATYRGIQVRGERFRIYFSYGGKRHYKTIALPPTPDTLKHYEGLVARIEQEIRDGIFVWERHFPSEPEDTSFGAYVKDWLESKRLEVTVSTYRAHRSRCNNWILTKWGSIEPELIDYRSIQKWTKEELFPCLTNKTIRDIHSILNQVFQHYRRCTGSKHNPTEGIRVRVADPVEPQPFTKKEIKQLLSTDADAGILNMVRFMLFSGLRLSEAIALAWEDCDLDSGIITVKRARVSSTYKVTKTRRSTRKVRLLREAKAALIAQHRITGERDAVDIEVIQHDNRTSRTFSKRVVFHNPTTGAAFLTADNFRFNYWNPLIERSGLPQRGPNQCRHTFASQLLSTGIVNVDYIANMLGHASNLMVYRHYGRWIQEDECDSKGKLDEALSLD